MRLLLALAGALLLRTGAAYCVSAPALDLSAVGVHTELAFDRPTCEFTTTVPACSCSVQLAMTGADAGAYRVQSAARPLDETPQGVSLDRGKSVAVLTLEPTDAAAAYRSPVTVVVVVEEAGGPLSDGVCVGLTDMLLLYSLPNTLVTPPVSPSFRECWRNYTTEVTEEVQSLMLVLGSADNATIFVNGEEVFQMGARNVVGLTNSSITTLTIDVVPPPPSAQNQTYLLDVVRVVESPGAGGEDWTWAYWTGGVVGAFLVPSALLAAYVARSRRRMAELESAATARLLPDGADSTEIPFEQLTVMERIAYGSSGLVYRGAFAGAEVAIKQLTGETSAEFEREAAILAGLRHPYIMRFYGTTTTLRDRYIVMEYYPWSLADFVRRKTAIDDRSYLQIATELAEGMAHLHARGILHRDLRPDNVLIDGAGHVKICNFGMASGAAAFPGASLVFAAPEVAAAAQGAPAAGAPRPDNASQDVYSFALLLVALRTLDASPAQPLTLSEAAFPPKLREMLHACLALAPEERPDFAFVLKSLQHGRLLDAPARLWTSDEWTSDGLRASAELPPGVAAAARAASVASAPAGAGGAPVGGLEPDLV